MFLPPRLEARTFFHYRIDTRASHVFSDAKPLIGKESDKVNSVEEDAVVYAELTRTDIYNYWEKEEKTIKKVEDPNWKRVDPA